MDYMSDLKGMSRASHNTFIQKKLCMEGFELLVLRDNLQAIQIRGKAEDFLVYFKFKVIFVVYKSENMSPYMRYARYADLYWPALEHL